ncbi:MAG: helix-turn-helix domain-containing protein [Gemmatimonadetes bacterium]|nr:helix-turn-helix domain-containing protein [Gemmatimonadota bacterium]
MAVEQPDNGVTTPEPQRIHQKQLCAKTILLGGQPLLHVATVSRLCTNATAQVSFESLDRISTVLGQLR